MAEKNLGIINSFALQALHVLHSVINRPLFVIILMLSLIVSSKLLLIGVLGSAVPFYDQWLAEAKYLYIPYLNADLEFKDLLIVHNEHHIFFTKLLNLGYLEIAGNWNPVFQMLANIVLHLMCLIIFVQIFRKHYYSRDDVILPTFTAILFFVPFDSDNTLWGFQSQFYFVIGMSLFAVPVAAKNAAFTIPWILALTVAALSFFAMGAGIGVLLSIALLCAVQMIAGVRNRSAKEIAGVLAFLAAVYFMLPEKTNDGMASIGQFIWGFGLAAGWPVPLPVIGVLVVNIPASILFLHLVREKTQMTSVGWTIIALLFWVGLQAALVSYARPGGTVTARYFDIYAFTPLLNLIAILELRKRYGPTRSPILAAVAGAWLCLIPASLVFYAAKFMPVEVSMNPIMVAARDKNFSKFVRTLDPAVLDKPFQEIPFDDSAELADLASRPEILGVLPDRFGAPAAARAAMKKRLVLGGGLNADPDNLKTLAYWAGTLLLAFCVSLIALACIMKSLLAIPPKTGAS